MHVSRVLLAVLLVSLCSGVGFAKLGFTNHLPNGSSFMCKTCHVTTTGGPTTWNSFGDDVKANMNGDIPDWAAVCEMDSDEDGWSNGEELLDPDCVWTTGDPMPGTHSDVTNPGDAASAPEDPEPEPEPDVVASDDVEATPADVSVGLDEDVSEAPEEDTVETPESDASTTSGADVTPGSTEDAGTTAAEDTAAQSADIAGTTIVCVDDGGCPADRTCSDGVCLPPSPAAGRSAPPTATVWRDRPAYGSTA